MVALIKKFQKTKSIYFRILVPGGPPHPVNWSPTHSTGPQTPFFSDISVMVVVVVQEERVVVIMMHISFADHCKLWQNDKKDTRDLLH